MKTYTFPYGSAEWDGTIDVLLSDKEAARLETSMKEEHFHLDEDPDLADIERKVCRQIVRDTKRRMVEDGSLNSIYGSNDPVYEELGNYHVCFPNAFDWIKKG